MMEKKILIILRGLPGAGKTSLAYRIGEFVCTADDYHMKDGVYCWTPENAHLAHIKCQEKVEWGMIEKISKIVVANTTTTLKELRPYYDLAQKYDYVVYSVIVENRHDGVNEHNVPEETLKKMRERFDIKL